MKFINNNLKKRNIIITRSQDTISEVKQIFEDKGATVFDLPALTIDYPDDLEPLDQALSDAKAFEWLIFSSSNGVKFLEKRLLEKGSCLKDFSKAIKIAVVGEKTSNTLNDLGIKADFIPPDFIADSLISNFPISPYGLRLFLPRVQTGGRNLISTEFTKAGAKVLEVPAYESRCPKSIPLNTVEALRKRIIDAMIFSSGKTVKNTSNLLKKYLGGEWLSSLNEVKLFTIGPQTTRACQNIFGRVDKEAEKYTFEGILDATIDYFSKIEPLE